MADEGVKIDTIEKLAVEMREGFVRSDKKIEQLATEMHEGFARTDERFVQQDQKINHIEEMVDALARAVKDGFELTATKAEMNKGFEGVNSRLEGVNRRIDDEVDQRIELGLRVEKVEAKVFPELQR
jgi:methyl-accepting chemotaxis protein